LNKTRYSRRRVRIEIHVDNTYYVYKDNKEIRVLPAFRFIPNFYGTNNASTVQGVFETRTRQNVRVSALGRRYDISKRNVLPNVFPKPIIHTVVPANVYLICSNRVRSISRFYTRDKLERKSDYEIRL